MKKLLIFFYTKYKMSWLFWGSVEPKVEVESVIKFEEYESEKKSILKKLDDLRKKNQTLTNQVRKLEVQNSMLDNMMTMYIRNGNRVV